MNTNLIIKVIKTNGDVCPDLLYNNPLLDKTVTRALSKNFVNILNVSRDNSNFNKNLRHSLLTYIRNVCQVQPKEHIKTDENVMNLVNDVYLRALENTDLNKLPCGLQERYSDFGLKYLMELHDQSEDELIMLLSHYPRWFEIYTNTLKQLDSGL
ncbi:uncharacterized protein LOC114244214 [Bombyx mandarina]|uniref:Uncharacterized protein LOC114244214 n=1 Tax=Bombyx mandarina TaxID=7092 RepID=A0A6J2JU90_BOMMA|nr:uncharacterized protein LOC114244214 [Bombyx mandarina]